MASSYQLRLLGLFVFPAIENAALGEIICEHVPNEMCTFVAVRRSTSARPRRRSVGISSDVLLEPTFMAKLCAPTCYDHMHRSVCGHPSCDDGAGELRSCSKFKFVVFASKVTVDKTDPNTSEAQTVDPARHVCSVNQKGGVREGATEQRSWETTDDVGAHVITFVPAPSHRQTDRSDTELFFFFFRAAKTEIKEVGYRPPGTQVNLLKDVSFSLREKSFGLIFGQSGSGKTTLLQLLAGLSKPTSGSVCLQRYTDDGAPKGTPHSLTPEKVGIVFQFPERYFIADTILDEVTFGWPRQKSSMQLKEQLALKLQRAFSWVGLDRISLDKNPQSLSGGYKRRLALAIQLVDVPDLLILDEPLAGLDWKARADVVKLLKYLKREVTILVVSHDLRELAGLVDQSWKMEMGGILRKDSLPI
ncbi:hypothetical protein MLD38_022610 [Melastoma candidum]|uniref:Uncharacterized protein n=1 Tax=Melastoma candidum TaxID=119954 RepID=A0ACB9QJW3_9MYRT|nr:hypothetical protein MLD38_022610 [Melastoma candidum]